MAAPHNWRDFEAEQATRELVQGASLSGERPTVTTPFQSGDNALAASIKEMKDKSLEYQRLATEESREQYENQAKANLQHENEVQQLIQDKAALSNSQDIARDVKQASILIRQMNAILASVPPGTTEHTMGQEKLKEYGNTLQELQRLQSAYYNPEAPNPNSAQFDAMLRNEMEGTQVQQQAVPAQTSQTMQTEQTIPQDESIVPRSFEDGTFARVKQLEDGTYDVTMTTGQRFVGTLDEVFNKAGKSLSYTTSWARQRQQQQPANGNSAVNYDQNGNAASVDFDKLDDVSKWELDHLASKFGYSDGTEYVNDQIEMKKTIKELQEWRKEKEIYDHNLETSSIFLANNPDFPNTPEAIEALMNVIEANDWELNSNSMLAANAVAIRQGLYKPLSQEQQAAALGIDVKPARPKAPPMLSSQSPDGNQRGLNPWDQKSVPLGDLRRMAIQQELEGNGKRLGE